MMEGQSTQSADLERVLALVQRRSSPLSPVALTVLALASAGGALLVGALWATEPEALPVRTRWAFALCILVAGAWCAFALDGLRRRRAPLASQRVTAAAMGCAFSALFMVVGVLTARAQAPPEATWAVGATGLTLTLCAGANWRRARQARADLVQLRRALVTETRPATRS